jgi:hypothetical protein
MRYIKFKWDEQGCYLHNYVTTTSVYLKGGELIKISGLGDKYDGVYSVSDPEDNDSGIPWCLDCPFRVDYRDADGYDHHYCRAYRKEGKNKCEMCKFYTSSDPCERDDEDPMFFTFTKIDCILEEL